LLRARQKNENANWFLAGMSLGSIALVRASMVPTIGAVLLWTVVWGVRGNIWKRLHTTSILVLAVAIMVLPFLVYTYHAIGAPVLSTDAGYELWVGNNPDTFSHYAAESIDRSAHEAWSRLTPVDRAELEHFGANEIARSNWFANRALAFIWENPW